MSSLLSLTKRLFLLLSALVIVWLAAPEKISRADVQTHYWLGRPIPPEYTTRQQIGFPYGGTRAERSPLHHGVDLLNKLNTPVIAAADGTVYYAGPDSEHIFGPYANFYGNVVVIQHDLTAPEGGTLFTLYGHLNAITVQAGQRVGRGQQIGAVGKSGIALWYHLHFEVRVGNPQDYNAVRNPELWYAPEPGTGKIVGRMVDSKGGLAMGIRFVITTPHSVIPNWTYANADVPSDPAYNENFVAGDLLAGCYRFRVKGRGPYAYDEPFCISSGETLIMQVQLKPF